MPSLRLDGDDAQRAAHGVAVGAADDAVRDDDGAVLLVDRDGPIAVAEPRNGALKPVVGFRA